MEGWIIVLGSQEVRERRKRLHEQIKHVLVARSELLGGGSDMEEEENNPNPNLCQESRY